MLHPFVSVLETGRERSAVSCTEVPDARHGFVRPDAGVVSVPFAYAGWIALDEPGDDRRFMKRTPSCAGSFGIPASNQTTNLPGHPDAVRKQPRERAVARVVAQGAAV